MCGPINANPCNKIVLGCLQIMSGLLEPLFITYTCLSWEAPRQHSSQNHGIKIEWRSVKMSLQFLSPVTEHVKRRVGERWRNKCSSGKCWVKPGTSCQRILKKFRTAGQAPQMFKMCLMPMEATLNTDICLGRQFCWMVSRLPFC